MTIASQISRLQNDKAAMKTAIENKGVTVGNVTLDSYAACIDAIEQGGGCKVAYTVVGGGGGGGRKNGGGGGAVCVGVGNIDSNTINVTVGSGGHGYGTGITPYNGGYSRICGGVDTVIACGGQTSFPCDCCVYSGGGMSGGGFAGGFSYGNTAVGGGGGGGGANGYGENGYNCCGGNGGPGIMGMGGGGGTYGKCSHGCGVDGGGDGGGCNCNGCDATNYGGGGGGGGYSICCGGNGCQGVVILCYPIDGSYGYSGAIGGAVSACGDYMVHTFTSDGTFKIADKVTTKGIYYNPYTCLISISGDGSNWITMQDRNIGATSNDISCYQSYGGLFQRGNNFNFQNRSISCICCSSSQINAGSCGASTYRSNIFRYDCTSTNKDWSSVRNDNLRGDVDNTCWARRGPSPCGFHIPTCTEIKTLISSFCSIKGSAITTSDMQTYFCMPYTGYRPYNCCATVNCATNCIGYWTSSATTTGSPAYMAGYLWGSNAPSSGTYVNRRGTGLALRAFANVGVQPDETWCKWL